MKLHLIPLMLVVVSGALAQQSGATGETRPRATPDKYPFGEMVRELAKDPFESAPVAGASDPKAQFQAKVLKAVNDGPELPEDQMPATSQLALAKAAQWMKDLEIPAMGKDGRVMYTFGAGLTTIVCAPLRVCVMELQPGEQVNGEPHIGDSVRWSVAPAASGAGASATYLVVIKPKEAGLDTNLMIPTNRRAYYVRLVSRQQEYLPLVAFSYPEDDAAKWRAAASAQQRTTEEFEAARITPVESVESMNWLYSIEGGTEFLRPVRVMDDGKKTYIQMPEGAAVREAPILVVSGLDSTAEMVNYRVKGSMYIVDRLFEHGALLLGSGKKQQRVDIIRNGSAAAKKEMSKGIFGNKPDAIEQAYLKRVPATEAGTESAAAGLVSKAGQKDKGTGSEK